MDTNENYDIKVKNVETFGWSFPKKDCWFYLINPAVSKGWKTVDVAAAEKSLNDNIKTCYNNIFTAELEDLNDSIHYTIFFDNTKKLYNVKLTNSNHEVLPEQKTNIFKSELFKNTALRAIDLIERGKNLIDNYVMDHIKSGDLLNIDETKLEAILHMLEDQTFMKNLRLRKYVK